VLRFGGRWAILSWSLPFLMMPVSSVFYPEAVLPPPLRAVAALVPMNHVFEGMRATLAEGRFAWQRALIASLESLIYLALVESLVSWVFRLALRRGLLPKVR